MKSKTNKVSACLEYYLQRRQYMDKSGHDGKKKVRKFVCTKDEFLLNNLVAASSSLSNSVSINSLSADPSLRQSLFNKLEEFIGNEGHNEKSKELEGLLFPLLLHIYTDLITSGFRTAASSFINEKSKIFPNKEMFDMLTSKSSDEKAMNNFLTELKKKKYKVNLSNEALQRLLIFLKDQSNMYILQILNRHVNIMVLYDDECPDSPVADVDPPSSTPQPTTTTTTTTTSTSTTSVEDSTTLNKSSDDALVADKKLDEVIEKLKKISAKMLPSVSQLHFTNVSQGLSCVSMFSDAKLLACGYEDASIQIWNLEPTNDIDCCHKKDADSNEGFELRGHCRSVFGLDFFPDGKWLLSASFDKTIRLWDLKKKMNVVLYRGHTYPVTGVQVSTEGSMFASCSFDQTLKLWTTDRIFPLRNFIGHTQAVNCVAWHPNNNYLASGSNDMTVRLWNVQDGRCVRLMLGHQGRIDALAFSPDGKLLASAGEDRMVKLWDLGTGSLLKNFSGHTAHVYTLAFNSHSSFVASGGMDGNLNIWDLEKSTSNSSDTDDSSKFHDPVASYPTKSDCIMHLKYSNRNILHSVTKQM